MEGEIDEVLDSLNQYDLEERLKNQMNQKNT